LVARKIFIDKVPEVKNTMFIVTEKNAACIIESVTYTVISSYVCRSSIVNIGAVKEESNVI
jgi:hypothetical protein